jgi:hypothetical protein
MISAVLPFNLPTFSPILTRFRLTAELGLRRTKQKSPFSVSSASHYPSYTDPSVSEFIQAGSLDSSELIVGGEMSPPPLVSKVTTLGQPMTAWLLTSLAF